MGNNFPHEGEGLAGGVGVGVGVNVGVGVLPLPVFFPPCLRGGLQRTFCSSRRALSLAVRVGVFLVEASHFWPRRRRGAGPPDPEFVLRPTMDSAPKRDNFFGIRSGVGGLILELFAKIPQHLTTDSAMLVDALTARISVFSRDVLFCVFFPYGFQCSRTMFLLGGPPSPPPGWGGRCQAAFTQV